MQNLKSVFKTEIKNIAEEQKRLSSELRKINSERNRLIKQIKRNAAIMDFYYQIKQNLNILRIDHIRSAKVVSEETLNNLRLD